MSELENLNMGELCVHYKVCRIKPCHAHCGEYLPKDYFVTDRPHGEWTVNGEDIDYICSVCGDVLPYSDEYDYKTDFCPNCGASMRVKNELNRVNKELNSEIEKSKSEIVPDYRDGWRLREGDENG